MNAECISNLCVIISGEVEKWKVEMGSGKNASHKNVSNEFQSCDSHMSYYKLPPNFMCPPFVHRRQKLLSDSYGGMSMKYEVCHAPNTKIFH